MTCRVKKVTFRFLEITLSLLHLTSLVIWYLKKLSCDVMHINLLLVYNHFFECFNLMFETLIFLFCQYCKKKM